MEQARFWSLIDAARAKGDTANALERALTALPADDIVSFDAWLFTYTSATRRQDLWAAVYLIRGGCSDDSFDYFRGWLVAQGEKVLLAAIHDPESLGAFGKKEMGDEGMLSVAVRAHESAHGPMPDRDERPSIEGASAWPADRFAHGEEWDRAFYEAHYPRLWAEHAFADPITGAITRARFWELVDMARAQPAGRSTSLVPRIVEVLVVLPIEEVIGFCRWMSAYNRALWRNDVRAACRVAIGDADIDAFAEFRGWLIAQGEAFLESAVRDPDALARSGRDPQMIHVASHIGQRRASHVHVDHQDTLLSEITGWPADGGEIPYTPATLRARLPRLTASRSDASLTGPYDPDSLPSYERKERATALLARAKDEDDARALVRVEEALRLMPNAVETRAARARLYEKLGRLEEAAADFAIGLSSKPRASLARFDHARVLLALGRKSDAITEAKRALADGHRPAEAWLSLHARESVPSRVRHAKFGDGTVVSVEGTGEQQKLVIDFADGRKTLLKRFVVAID